jgi:hypothetical protein
MKNVMAYGHSTIQTWDATHIKETVATDAVSLINKGMTEGPFWEHVLGSDQPKK